MTTSDDKARESVSYLLRQYLNRIEELNAEIERLRDELHYCNGTCDLAMKHRNEAEAEVARLRAALAKRQEPDGEREERVVEWLRSRGYSVRRALEGE